MLGNYDIDMWKKVLILVALAYCASVARRRITGA